MLKRILKIVATLALLMVLAEVLLQLLDPYPTRINSGRVSLKANFTTNYHISNPLPGMDSIFSVQRNVLGLRGTVPDSGAFKIVAIGSSTTECPQLSEHDAWPATLERRLNMYFNNVWVGNAGIDGSTTYGQAILLEDYIVSLQPEFALLLVGVNDRLVENFEDETGILADQPNSGFRNLLKKSQLANLIDNWLNSGQTKTIELPGRGPQTKQLNAKGLDNFDQQQVDALQPGYAQRLRVMVEICRQNDIIPVLITQPLLDPGHSSGWKTMEVYNETVRKVSVEQNVKLIDLARLMQKKPEYYLDNMHLSPDGAAEVTERLLGPIKGWMNAMAKAE